MALGMFAKAATLAPVKTALSKAEKKQIPIDGLLAYAQIGAAIKALEALQASYEPEVKGRAFDQMLILAGNSKPESFTGVDGMATASMEFRKRGANSALKDDECALLTANGIVPHKEVTCQELFAINPKYAADASLLGKVEKALAKIVPEDFIVQQAEKSKMVVTEANVVEVFAARPKLTSDVFASLVKTVITQAVKPKLAETNFDNIMADIATLIAKQDSAIEEA